MVTQHKVTQLSSWLHGDPKRSWPQTVLNTRDLRIIMVTKVSDLFIKVTSKVTSLQGNLVLLTPYRPQTIPLTTLLLLKSKRIIFSLYWFKFGRALFENQGPKLNIYFCPSIPCRNGRPAWRGPVTFRKLPFEDVETVESRTWFKLSDVYCCRSITSSPTLVDWQIALTGLVADVFCYN